EVLVDDVVVNDQGGVQQLECAPDIQHPRIVAVVGDLISKVDQQGPCALPTDRRVSDPLPQRGHLRSVGVSNLFRQDGLEPRVEFRVQLPARRGLSDELRLDTHGSSLSNSSVGSERDSCSTSSNSAPKVRYITSLANNTSSCYPKSIAQGGKNRWNTE